MILLTKLKRFFNTGLHIRLAAARTERHIIYAMRHDALIEKAMSSTESGVTDTRYLEHDVIVSLTTFGKRLYDVAPTIESIMQGSVKPNRIVLWLGEDLKGSKLPLALQNQQKRGLEIFFCKDVRSYTKLVPALCKYPDAAIITIDDDAIYNYDLVENLVNKHIEFPHHVIANRIHQVVLGTDNRPVSYLDWKWHTSPTEDSPLYFATGVGGVLYPPHTFPDEVFNESVFMDICKYADDVWFYAMELMAGVRVKKSFTHSGIGEDYIVNDEVQDVGLYNKNTKGKNYSCGNDAQIRAVFDKYELWDKFNNIIYK